MGCIVEKKGIRATSRDGIELDHCFAARAVCLGQGTRRDGHRSVLLHRMAGAALVELLEHLAGRDGVGGAWMLGSRVDTLLVVERMSHIWLRYETLCVLSARCPLRCV